MSYDLNNRYASGYATDRASFDEGLRRYMLGVYNYMAAGLGLSGLVAALIAYNPTAFSLFYQRSFDGRVGFSLLGLISVFAPLAILFYASFRARTLSLGAVKGLYWAFTAIQGIGLSVLMLRYTGASLVSTFFVTASAFAGLSLYGYTTRRSLSGLGSFLVMGVWGLLVLMLVNMFVHSASIGFAIPALGVLIFSGLVAYDTQNIKSMYASEYGADMNGKLSIFGAWSLYINFINLFQFLLQFMGDRR